MEFGSMLPSQARNAHKPQTEKQKGERLGYNTDADRVEVEALGSSVLVKPHHTDFVNPSFTVNQGAVT
jgi:hypothetical protein